MVQLRLDRYLLDPLMRDLVGHYRRPSAYLVYLYLWLRASESPGGEAALSLRDLADGTGLSKSAVQAALRHLATRKLVSARRATPTAVPVWRVHEPWRR